MTDVIGRAIVSVEALVMANGIDEFHGDLDRRHLIPLWRVAGQLLPGQPKPCAIPYLWRWKELHALAMRAAELVPVDRAAERRVLALANPGLPGASAATPTLWGAVQILMPGELAPAHRHSPAALRFILQGEGAYTTVEGEKCVMRRGDLVLTPPWRWHDHGNEGRAPVIWFDGLDIPLVAMLDASFFEPFEEWTQKSAPGRSDRWSYPWAEIYPALAALAERDSSPFEDLALQYVTASGGPVLPTLACWVQRLRPEVRTRAHRHVSSAVYVAFEGTGFSVINGERFSWSPGDMFAVPPWAWHEHANPSSTEDAILFSIHDTPVLQALGLQREEAYDAHGGHQPVVREFAG
ncbi:MAG: cupin domain-containing protein [Candidatus Methylomirabilia bacterium]